MIPDTTSVNEVKAMQDNHPDLYTFCFRIYIDWREGRISYEAMADTFSALLNVAYSRDVQAL